MQETWVQYLSQEDPLEKEIATHSSILAWWIPWTEEPGQLQSIGSQKSGMIEQLTTTTTMILLHKNQYEEIFFFEAIDRTVSLS